MWCRNPLLLVVLVVLSFSGGAKETNESEAVKTKVQDYLTQQYQKRGFSGVVYVEQDGNSVFEGAFGQASRSLNIPMQKEHRFIIGSITKGFTSYVIWQLVANEQISLTEPVLTYLPQFNDPSRGKINIQHLLDHSSGLKHWGAVEDFLMKRSLSEIEPMELVNLYSKQGLSFEPGTKSKYSSIGYYMLGLVIEKVTGDSLAKAYSKYIFEPAQMKDTQLQTDASVLAGLVPSYRYNFIEAKYDSSEIRHPSSTFSTGGLVSSARDLTKWLKFVQQNKAYFDSSTDKGRGQGAMGWRVGLPGIKEADAYVWHGGLVTGYRSQITQSRDGKQRVVVLSNQRDAETMEISADILNILNGKDDVIVSKSLTKEVLQVSYHKGNQAAVERFLEIVNKDTGEFSKDDTQVLIAAMELKSDGACDRALPLIDAWKRVYKGSNYYGFADKLSSQCRSTN